MDMCERDVPPVRIVQRAPGWRSWRMLRRACRACASRESLPRRRHLWVGGACVCECCCGFLRGVSGCVVGLVWLEWCGWSCFEEGVHSAEGMAVVEKK